MHDESDSGHGRRLRGRPEPTPGGSVYVQPQATEWRPSQFEGIDIKVL
jgi:hypothetical protein